MNKILRVLVLTLCWLVASPAWAQPIPLDTWIAIARPTNLLGPNYTAALYEKHLSLAYVPTTKRLYFHGGDTRTYMVGPSGVAYGGTSYYQGMHSLDLNLRLASPGQVNAGWATEYPFCSTGSDVQPKHPDFVGIQWVGWLNKLVIVPGLFYVSNINCPGETPNYAADPQYVWRKIMSFDLATKKWAVLSGNNGLISSNAPWHFYADPVTRQFVRVLNSGPPLEGHHYDPATDAWTRYRTTGNALDCTHSHFAVLDRKMYCASRGNGLFGVYDLDAHTASVVGSLPGALWPGDRVPSDKGYVFAVPQARTIVYAERLALGTAQYRIWAWKPEAPTWVRIDTLPWQTLDGETLPAGEMPQGTSGVVDPDTGILYLTGCYDCSARYSWAIKLSSEVTPPPPAPSPPPPPAPAPAPAQRPTLRSIAPSPVASGSAGFKLAVTGTGFVSGLKATLGGQARTVTFGSATQVIIGVLAADVVNAGNVEVRVTNPGSCAATGTTGDCVSNAMQLMVSPPTPAPPPPPPPPANQKISIQVTPPNCVDVSVNGVLIPGNCAAPLAPANP